jgi:hypothetical protein
MVAIVFRTSGAWGAGQGFNLTAVQVDTNFYNLKTAVEALVTTPPTAVSIASFEVIGTSLYIHMTDASVQGPFTLPSTVYNPRGAWQPSTPYLINDIVSAGGSAYFVIWNHTSGLTFDAGANDGAGHDFYQLFFSSPSNALPVGGVARQALAKVSSGDFDVAWTTGLVPNGGTIGQYLGKVSSTDQDVAWTSLPAAGAALPINTISSSTYTYLPTDAGQYVRFTAPGTITLTIPTNAVQAIPVGSEITSVATQATLVSIASAGVTVNVPTGFTLAPFGPGAVWTIKKIGTNTWDAFGLLKPSG